MSTLQRTRLADFQLKVGRQLHDGFAGSWWRRSSGLIIVLAGFFVGSNFTVHLENITGARTFSALFALLGCEFLALIRHHSPWLNYFRLGFVYAIILEAFKVGS
ncbi:DUF565 domain-containing protein [Synechococcus sp. M16CYN]|uniref:DUF565 domain-containing protein n=1 Tax=Synechococcus sp. M16CYN TaxID=3103139 RepID=UPI003247D3D5